MEKTKSLRILMVFFTALLFYSVTLRYASAADTDPPSMLEYPVIDYSINMIDVTFDESNMQNATTGDNYAFSPTLSFSTAGGSDDIGVSGNTYTLILTDIPKHTIFTLTVSNITDQAGNPVTPSSIKINDDDSDDMADDWEAENGVDDPQSDPDLDNLTNSQEFSNNTNPNHFDTDGDTLPDEWEVTYGLDPNDGTGTNGGDGDYDNDGWTNEEEYKNSYDPTSDTSPPPSPPETIETIPCDGQGIDPDTKSVHVDASFAVLVESTQGIDITDAASIRFTIDDGENAAYERDLSNNTVVRIVELAPYPDTKVRELWAVYDRSNDDGMGLFGYPFGKTINIRVDTKDRRGDWMIQASYSFQVETEIEYSLRTAEQAITDITTVGSSKIVTLITEDARNGFKVAYDTAEKVTPYFELAELPQLQLDFPEITPVGMAVDLQPPTVFSIPVTVTVPCPGVEDIKDVALYLYNGAEWVYACSSYNSGGHVQDGGRGWMVPGSLKFDSSTNPPTLETQVYHFSAIQAGVVGALGDGEDVVEEDEGTLQDIYDTITSYTSGGCFITIASVDIGKARREPNVNQAVLLFGCMVLVLGVGYWVSWFLRQD